MFVGPGSSTWIRGGSREVCHACLGCCTCTPGKKAPVEPLEFSRPKPKRYTLNRTKKLTSKACQCLFEGLRAVVAGVGNTSPRKPRSGGAERGEQRLHRGGPHGRDRQALEVQRLSRRPVQSSLLEVFCWLRLLLVFVWYLTQFHS